MEPWQLLTVWASKPFSRFQDLHQAFVKFTTLLNQQTKEGLIRCYPDLTGRLIRQVDTCACTVYTCVCTWLLNIIISQLRIYFCTTTGHFQFQFQFPFQKNEKNECSSQSLLMPLGIAQKYQSVIEEVINYLQLCFYVTKCTMNK